ncbi:MAG: hypothetical protein ABJA37_07960 [Ferruginibacter sp.]
MKMQTPTLFLNLLGKEEVKRLTTIVTEVLADYRPALAPKVFSAAQLWNIQRQKKSVGQRRFLR